MMSEADLAGEVQTVLHVLISADLAHQARCVHRIFERAAGLPHLDSAKLRADQLNVVLFQDPESAS